MSSSKGVKWVLENECGLKQCVIFLKTVTTYRTRLWAKQPTHIPRGWYPYLHFTNEKTEAEEQSCYSGSHGLGPRCLCFHSSQVVTALCHGGQTGWQQHRNPHTGPAPVSPRAPTGFQGLYLELDAELPPFVSFWYQASCHFPGDTSGPQLRCWLLRIAPLGGSRELLAIFQTPWKKGSCSQPRKCPLRDWLWFGGWLFFFITVTLATSKFSGCFIVSSARSGDNLPLCWERQKLSSRNPGLVCVHMQSTGFPIVILGEEKADVNHYPLRIHLAVL